MKYILSTMLFIFCSDGSDKKPIQIVRQNTIEIVSLADFIHEKKCEKCNGRATHCVVYNKKNINYFCFDHTTVTNTFPLETIYEDKELKDKK